MKRSISKITILALALMVLVSGITLAEKDGKKAHKGQRMEKMAKELNLSDKQIEQLKELRDGNGKEHFKSMKEARQDLREAVNSGASESVLRSKIEKVEQLREEAMQHRMEQKEKVKSILTTEQYAKMMVMKEEKFEKRKEKRGKEGKFEKRGQRTKPDENK